MCFSKGNKAETPAAAPAPPLEAPDAPEIGEARRKENEELFGDDTPSYRVSRKDTGTTVNPNQPIVM